MLQAAWEGARQAGNGQRTRGTPPCPYTHLRAGARQRKSGESAEEAPGGKEEEMG